MTIARFEKQIGAGLKAQIKDELGYDSDLMQGESDEERLDKMPELAR